jgi:hypothetical protein
VGLSITAKSNNGNAKWCIIRQAVDMLDRNSGTGRPVIIRRKMWQVDTVITTGIVAALCVAPVFYTLGAAPLLAGPALLVVGGWLMFRLVRVEITESTVRIQQMAKGRGDLEVPRSEIREIHFYKGRVVFQDPDGRPVMESVPQWPLKQMQKVADVLGVPLYDHRPRKLSASLRLVWRQAEITDFVDTGSGRRPRPGIAPQHPDRREP